NGIITAIGSNVAVPANAQRVDVSGKHIYPGLIDANSAMGLEEIGAVDVTLDTDERSEEHTSELQSREKLVCRLLLEKKKNTMKQADADGWIIVFDTLTLAED